MNLLLLLKILVPVYLVAVNVYSFLLLRAQKNAVEYDEQKVKDVKIYFSAIFGGAIGIYAGMLALKYRLKNFCLMVLMPILIAVTLYFSILGFTSGFWIQ